MCSFIILLLLLCKNGGNGGCNCSYNYGGNCVCYPGDYARDRNRSCDIDYGCADAYDRNHEEERDCNCGCSACEESVSDTSPIKDREDIWTSYKNPSSGRQSK